MGGVTNVNKEMFLITRDQIQHLDAARLAILNKLVN